MQTLRYVIGALSNHVEMIVGLTSLHHTPEPLLSLRLK